MSNDDTYNVQTTAVFIRLCLTASLCPFPFERRARVRFKASKRNERDCGLKLGPKTRRLSSASTCSLSPVPFALMDSSREAENVPISEQHSRRDSRRMSFLTSLGVQLNAMFDPPGAEEYVQEHAYKPSMSDAATQTFWEPPPPPPPPRRRSVFEQVSEMTFVKTYKELDDDSEERVASSQDLSASTSSDSTPFGCCRSCARSFLGLVSPFMRLPCCRRLQRLVADLYRKHAKKLLEAAKHHGGALRSLSVFAAAGAGITSLLEMLSVANNSLFGVNYSELLLALYLTLLEAVVVMCAPRNPARLSHQPSALRPCEPALLVDQRAAYRDAGTSGLVRRNSLNGCTRGSRHTLLSASDSSAVASPCCSSARSRHPTSPRNHARPFWAPRVPLSGRCRWPWVSGMHRPGTHYRLRHCLAENRRVCVPVRGQERVAWCCGSAAYAAARSTVGS